MNYHKLLLTTIFLCVTLFAKSQLHVDTVLKKASIALQSLETITYDQKRVVNERSVKNYNTYQGHVFFNFKDTSNILKATYIFENNDYKIIYNGTENFELDKKNKSLEILQNDLSTFNSLSFINHSIYTLRNFIPSVINNSNIQKKLGDTTIASKEYYNLTLSLGQETIDNIGRLRKLSGKANMQYSIIIDKASFLPRYLKRTNLSLQDEVMVDYTNLVIINPVIQQESWYYSNYTSDFKLKNPIAKSLIEKGREAIDFQLSDLSTNNRYSLGSLKKKVLLLEFFIKNCGYCVGAVPELNKLHEEYKEKGLEILGINTHDTKESVINFIAATKPQYPIAINGGNTAEQYGVSYYPCVVLINRLGKIIFSGAFDLVKINDILKNINKL